MFYTMVFAFFGWSKLERQGTSLINFFYIPPDIQKRIPREFKPPCLYSLPDP